MSTPTMNHNSHMHQRQEQQQQQQQQVTETQHAHSNSANSPHATLTRSDSTSTVILEEEETRACRRNGLPTLAPSFWANISTQLRSVLKTSGLFNNDLESSGKLNELLADGNEFTLQRLLSELNPNDLNFDMNELMKMDSAKLLDSRTLSEFLRSESFDQLIASSFTNNQDVITNPSTIPCSTVSFSELRPVSPELLTNTIFNNESNQLKMQSNNALLYNEMDSLNASAPLASTSTQYDYNEGALSAFEHDHAFLSKRAPVAKTSKRTATRGSRRTSSRIQSRAVVCPSPADSSSSKSKSTRNVHRATDIETSDDLSYYLERRRKNNEASKLSRAARKQKFGDMSGQCDEYERVNADLRRKIATLETVTASLKNGLVNNFQRKSGV